MSETDARMAFERHATSKIRSIDDLFRIKTMGFRGEALASIAAVSQVELKTRRSDDPSGVLIEIENSNVIKQEPVAFNAGCSIAMKNLFFNVPARRNFLKSNAAELRHIVDEFIRVAMAFPELFFSFTSNGQEVFHLEKGSLKQRIVQILGSNYTSKLVSVQEETDYMNISGFVGKPETAKKTRGDQYLFVNNRFIRSAYLNHAVMNAFSEMIPKDSFPMYTLFIDLDPAQLDINVHPTKQEIKFEDEKIVYAFVQSAVKHALAQFSITPTLDFELDAGIQSLDAISKPFNEEKQPSAETSSLYRSFTQKNQAHLIESRSDLQSWNDLKSKDVQERVVELVTQSPTVTSTPTITPLLNVNEERKCVQLHNTYIMVPDDAGFIIIHQQNAHERILYERFQAALQGKPALTQQSLFPATISLTPQDSVLLQELLPDLQTLGYILEPFGSNTYVVQGSPAGMGTENESNAIEKLLEQYKHFSNDLKFSKGEKLLRSIALQHAIKAGVVLSKKEMDQLVYELFACAVPNTSPNGKPAYMTFKKSELDKMFGR